MVQGQRLEEMAGRVAGGSQSFCRLRGLQSGEWSVAGPLCWCSAGAAGICQDDEKLKNITTDWEGKKVEVEEATRRLAKSQDSHMSSHLHSASHVHDAMFARASARAVPSPRKLSAGRAEPAEHHGSAGSGVQ